VCDRKPLYLGKIAFDPVGTRCCNVLEAGLQILVDACSKAVEMKVWRQVAIVILKLELIHLGLEHSDRVYKLWKLDGPKEDTTAALIVEVEIKLLLETEVYEVFLSKGEDIVHTCPDGDLN
jgi:hypothetical protein